MKGLKQCQVSLAFPALWSSSRGTIAAYRGASIFSQAAILDCWSIWPSPMSLTSNPGRERNAASQDEGIHWCGTEAQCGPYFNDGMKNASVTQTTVSSIALETSA